MAQAHAKVPKESTYTLQTTLPQNSLMSHRHVPFLKE